MYCSSLVARSRRGVNSNSSGVSSMNRVVQLPARNVGSLTSRMRNGNVRLDAANAELLQAAFRATDGLVEVAAPGRDLHQQRVVERKHDRAGEGRAAVESDAHAARRTIVRDLAVVRHEFVRRIFGRHAALDREAVRRDLILRRQADRRAIEPFALRHQNLRSHHVDAGHFLRDGVLDLNPRVDLDEVQVVGVRVDEELDRPRVVVVDGAANGDRGVANLLADGRPADSARERFRPPSGAAAAPSSRAPTDGRDCRGCRRATAPRCAAPAR